MGGATETEDQRRRIRECGGTGTRFQHGGAEARRRSGGLRVPLSARRASRGWSSPTSADTSKPPSPSCLYPRSSGNSYGRPEAGLRTASRAAPSPVLRYLRSSVLILSRSLRKLRGLTLRALTLRALTLRALTPWPHPWCPQDPQPPSVPQLPQPVGFEQPPWSPQPACVTPSPFGSS